MSLPWGRVKAKPIRAGCTVVGDIMDGRAEVVVGVLSRQHWTTRRLWLICQAPKKF